jgi:DNA-binding NarL/FixJ family response regulator
VGSRDVLDAAILIRPGAVMPSNDIAVIVRSADPLTQAGAISHLRYTPGLELVESQPRPGRVQVAVVLAQRMDEMTVVELRRLTREPGQRVVLVTDRLREHELMTVLEYGVRTILWRSDVTPSRLAGAVRAAANGESQLPQDLLGQLMGQVGRSQRAAAAAGLAPREIDVLKLLAEGLDTREVAEKLVYSERTIKNVLSGVMTRLRLRNRAHAVAYALREGYI